MSKLIAYLLLGVLSGLAPVWAMGDGLCYSNDLKQLKPVFGLDTWSSSEDKRKGLFRHRIRIFGQQRDYYGYPEVGDKREFYTSIPISDNIANPKQEKYMKIKLENYSGGSNPDLIPVTPQWLGKTLEFRLLRPPLPEDTLLNPNDPKHRKLYFTVTVDGKDTYQCGANQSDDE